MKKALATLLVLITVLGLVYLCRIELGYLVTEEANAAMFKSYCTGEPEEASSAVILRIKLAKVEAWLLPDILPKEIIYQDYAALNIRLSKLSKDKEQSEYYKNQAMKYLSEIDKESKYNVFIDYVEQVDSSECKDLTNQSTSRLRRQTAKSAASPLAAGY